MVKELTSSARVGLPAIACALSNSVSRCMSTVMVMKKNCFSPILNGSKADETINEDISRKYHKRFETLLVPGRTLSAIASSKVLSAAAGSPVFAYATIR